MLVIFSRNTCIYVPICIMYIPESSNSLNFSPLINHQKQTVRQTWNLTAFLGIYGPIYTFILWRNDYTGGCFSSNLGSPKSNSLNQFARFHRKNGTLHYSHYMTPPPQKARRYHIKGTEKGQPLGLFSCQKETRLRFSHSRRLWQRPEVMILLGA